MRGSLITDAYTGRRRVNVIDSHTNCLCERTSHNHSHIHIRRWPTPSTLFLTVILRDFDNTNLFASFYNNSIIATTMVSTFTRRPLRAQGAANNSLMMVKQRSSDFDYSCTSVETDDTSLSALGDSSHTLLSSSEVDTSTTSTSQQQQQPRSPCRVRFAQSKDGQVQCEYHQVENVINPALWWQRDEIAKIRQDVSAWVTTHETKTRAILKSTTKFLAFHDDARAARRLLMQMSACPDARGLELAAAPGTSGTVSTLVKAVLEAQSQVQGSGSSSSSSKRLRRVSKRISKPARELALTRAQHDRKEALKASLTAWE